MSVRASLPFGSQSMFVEGLGRGILFVFMYETEPISPAVLPHLAKKQSQASGCSGQKPLLPKIQYRLLDKL